MARKHTVFPAEFPESWASDWGEDDFGIFMGFTYKDVRQLFRWIEPGIFLMGASENELERNSDEVQHEVTLTKGFWLADTTVTQALWKAVMGENPSRFKGENYPVENVTWNDTQTFISKLNRMKAELRLCLPTEAQWEYACRAETTTRYAFGNELTKEQANFSASGTVAVANYPANAWGLYDMHGNVWECCQDKYGDYSKHLVVDPLGVNLGFSYGLIDSDRVLRGGSWRSNAKSCRSGTRDYYDPVKREVLDNLGFRLARSHNFPHFRTAKYK